MMVHLEDGPAAGRDVQIPDQAVRSGYILIPYNLTGSGYSIARYEMRRYVEPWQCLVPGVWRMEAVHAALPLHKWFFAGHHWTRA